MAVYSLELKDKRILDIEADDEQSAMQAADDWYAANPYKVTNVKPSVDPRVAQLQEPGPAENALRGIPGVGGLLDEFGAGADAAINYVTGGESGDTYDNALATRRDAQRQSDAENPIRNTAEKLIGGGMAAAALPFARPFQGASGAGLMAAAADGALNAAAYAAAQGFAEGEGGLQNRVQNATDYAQTGALVGGALGAAGQGVANRLAGTPANSLPAVAQQIGVQVPRFMEGGAPSRQVASKIGALPFVGDDVNAALANTRQQTAQAAQGIADRTSPGATPQGAGEAVRGSMADWAGPVSRKVQDQIYEPVNKKMANVVAPLSNTRQAAQELARQNTAAAAPLHAAAIREVEEALGRPNGLSFEGITRLRTRIGQMRDNAIDPNNRTATAGLSALYGGLTRDMETAVTTQGGPAALRYWRSANRMTQRLADRRDTVAKIIGTEGDKAGESIVDKLVTMASSKSTGDARRLMLARHASGPDSWSQLSAAAIGRMGRNQSNEFSADIFLKNYTQLSDRGRRLLFNKDTTADLNKLAEVSRGLQQYSRMGNPSGTGGVTALLAALGGAASGDMGATMGVALGGRGIGMLLSRPAVVRTVSRYAQAYQRFLNGRATRAQLSALAAVVAAAVSKETGEDPNVIQQRISAAGSPTQ